MGTKQYEREKKQKQQEREREEKEIVKRGWKETVGISSKLIKKKNENMNETEKHYNMPSRKTRCWL